MHEPLLDIESFDRENERFLNELTHYTWIDEPIEIVVECAYGGTVSVFLNMPLGFGDPNPEEWLAPCRAAAL